MTYETLSETEWERVERIWAMLDEGQAPRARLEIASLLDARPGHPDLRIVDAAVSLDENDPAGALEALRGAERSADPAFFFHLRATALFELVRLEDARDDAERALAIRSDLAEAHDLLGRVLEHLGDTEGAAEHTAEAEAIDSESFPSPLDVSETEFDELVERGIKELPEPVRKHLEELPVLVEALPSREMLTASSPPLAPDILGLFVGRDLMTRSHGDVPDTPGAIYLFRRNLLRVTSDREELSREIRVTVRHEVGHLLGLDEDELERWGLG
jgi:predicted Zn-dependent protease with MMP-like domain